MRQRGKVSRALISAIKILSEPKTGFTYDGPKLRDDPKSIDLAVSGNQPKSALFACITILTGIFARLDHQLYKRDSNGFFVVDEESPLNDLLHKPSSLMNGYSLRELIYWDVFRKGNGCAKVIRDSDGNPVELRYCKLLTPRVRYENNRRVFDVLFPSNFKESVQEPCYESDLLHLKWWGYSPFDGVSPSPVETHVIQTQGLYNASIQHQMQTLNKGFSARNVIENDIEVDENTLVEFRDKIEDLYSGNINAGKTPILFPGMSLKSVGWSTVDLQLIEILKYAVTDLSRAYGIPLFILQADERTSGWSSNSLPDRWMNFERTTVSSHEARFGAEWSMKVLPPRMRSRDYRIGINPESLTMSNTAQRAATAKVIYMSGVATKNEARKLLGLPPLPGGDSTIDPPGGPKQGQGRGNE